MLNLVQLNSDSYNKIKIEVFSAPNEFAGAFMVGAATVIVTMYIIREAYKFRTYITDEHFNLMGKLLVLTSLVYLYFNLNEFMVPG